MPVILRPVDHKAQLDPHVQNVDRLQPLLHPCALGQMEAYPVSTRVNNPANDTQACTAPLA